MIVPAAFSALLPAHSRAAAVAELRVLLSRQPNCSQRLQQTALAFGLAALDGRLPNGGLAGGALHEVVPATQAALPVAIGFIVAALARFNCLFPAAANNKKIIFVMPGHQARQCGRLSGHGLKRLGFDPSRAVLIETAHRHDTLWAVLEALRSQAPQAVVGMVDKLDLKTSQKLHLAATDSGLPLLLLRPSQTLESSAAATRWRIGAATAARDRFGSYARPRWHLQLERCRNGRPGEWVVEYDHVAYRFSLVAALADQTLSCGAGEQSRRQAGRS
jgi:protein ImuA